MARRLFPGQNLAFGLSLFLFTFMFIPTLVVLLAVVAFFLFVYPRLQNFTPHPSFDVVEFRIRSNMH
ncbi:hypothetical protein BJY04DRAFT_224556 [Aspergillus karnatakaensis]|uniref:uncharacterized protein n=1 Tax=Aspergillus karnatakaensis TaxID=1810916 RepID=UPI003CCD2386